MVIAIAVVSGGDGHKRCLKMYSGHEPGTINKSPLQPLVTIRLPTQGEHTLFPSTAGPSRTALNDCDPPSRRQDSDSSSGYDLHRSRTVTYGNRIKARSSENPMARSKRSEALADRDKGKRRKTANDEHLRAHANGNDLPDCRSATSRRAEELKQGSRGVNRLNSSPQEITESCRSHDREDISTRHATGLPSPVSTPVANASGPSASAVDEPSAESLGRRLVVHETASSGEEAARSGNSDIAALSTTSPVPRIRLIFTPKDATLNIPQSSLPGRPRCIVCPTLTTTRDIEADSSSFGSSISEGPCAEKRKLGRTEFEQSITGSRDDEEEEVGEQIRAEAPQTETAYDVSESADGVLDALEAIIKDHINSTREAFNKEAGSRIKEMTMLQELLEDERRKLQAAERMITAIGTNLAQTRKELEQVATEKDAAILAKTCAETTKRQVEVEKTRELREREKLERANEELKKELQEKTSWIMNIQAAVAAPTL